MDLRIWELLIDVAILNLQYLGMPNKTYVWLCIDGCILHYTNGTTLKNKREGRERVWRIILMAMESLVMKDTNLQSSKIFTRTCD